MRLAIAVAIVSLNAGACSGPPGTTPVPIPPDSPLTLADCGWPSGTPILLARRGTVASLNLPPSLGAGNADEVVYVLVTLNRVEVTPSGGTPTDQERGACVKAPDGRIVTGPLPRDWGPQP